MMLPVRLLAVIMGGVLLSIPATPLPAQSPIDSLEQLYHAAATAERRAALAEELIIEYTFVEMDSARNWLATLRRIATEERLPIFEGRALLAECFIYTNTGELPQARPLCEEGLALLRHTTDTERRVDGYVTLSDILHREGRYDAGMDTLFVALRLAKTLAAPVLLGSVYGALGEQYLGVFEEEKALDYLRLAEEQYTAAGANDELAANYYMQGTVLRDLGDLDGAENYYARVLETAGPQQRDYVQPYIYNALGTIHVARREYAASLAYNLKSLPIFEERQELHGVTSALRGIAHDYIKLKQAARALPYLQRAQPLAEQMNDAFQRADVANLLAMAHADLREYRPAYDYLRAAHTLGDSVFSQRSAAQLADAETRYRTETVENELLLAEQTGAAQAAQLALQRNRLWSLGGLLLLGGLLVAGLVIALRSRRRKNQLIQQQAHEKEVLMRELHHRVKNNLSVLSGILSLQSHKTADPGARRAILDSRTRVEAMGLIHRKLYQRENLTSIDIRTYIEELSEMIFDAYGFDHETAGLQLEVPPMKIDVETAIPLGLLINEILSNTFKHGFPAGAPPRRPELMIRLEPLADKLHLRLSDNGVGLPTDFEVPIDNPRRAKTFGTQLLGSLIKQLDATLTIGRGPGSQFDFLIHNFKLAA